MMRHLARTNLFYLLTQILKRTDAEHPWIYDRCKEVYDRPDNHLDLWARGHYKSTIITYAKTIQDILLSYGDGAIEPKARTFGIFSHTRPIAAAFCSQIKREFEANDTLRSLFPDICWENPRKDAPIWSNYAFTVKGGTNPKEATVEAWGLVESQPTSKHFDVRIYDDVVTRDSIGTPEQIQKTTESWELSLNLAATDGIARYIGTRYYIHDTYREIMVRGGVIPRVHPATHNGELDGEPVFWTSEIYAEKLKMGTTTAACQLMQNPKAAAELGFNSDDLRYYQERPDPTELDMNVYLLIDPAGTKSKRSDWTAIGVVALGTDQNYYVLELIRDKLKLTERAALIMSLHRRYRPIAVGYEQYGIQADIEHIEYEQEKQHYRFDITPLGGNQLSKNQRIAQLEPILEQHRLWLPRQQWKTLYDGRKVDVIDMFVRDEVEAWPVSGNHEDALDMLARIVDPVLGAEFPVDEWTMSGHNTARNAKRAKRNYDWIL